MASFISVAPAIATVASWSQPINACEPIVVTVAGIEIAVNSSQLLNAPIPIVVTDAGISIDVISFLPPGKALQKK